MSQLGERVSYLRGLADGMNLKEDKPESKLMLQMLGVMQEMAEMIDLIGEDQEQLENDMDLVDQELEVMHEILMGDLEDDEGFEFMGPGEGDFTELQCQNCGEVVYFDTDALEQKERGEWMCPECGKQMFPDLALPEN